MDSFGVYDLLTFTFAEILLILDKSFKDRIHNICMPNLLFISLENKVDGKKCLLKVAPNIVCTFQRYKFLFLIAQRGVFTKSSRFQWRNKKSAL